MVPQVVEEQCCVPQVATYDCCVPQVATQCDCCSTQCTEAELAVLHARRALDLMIQRGDARPGEIRRARRTLARLVIRLRSIKAAEISGVHR